MTHRNYGTRPVYEPPPARVSRWRAARTVLQDALALIFLLVLVPFITLLLAAVFGAAQ